MKCVDRKPIPKTRKRGICSYVKHTSTHLSSQAVTTTNRNPLSKTPSIRIIARSTWTLPRPSARHLEQENSSTCLQNTVFLEIIFSEEAIRPNPTRPDPYRRSNHPSPHPPPSPPSPKCHLSPPPHSPVQTSSDPNPGKTHVRLNDTVRTNQEFAEK